MAEVPNLKQWMSRNSGKSTLTFEGYFNPLMQDVPAAVPTSIAKTSATGMGLSDHYQMAADAMNGAQAYVDANPGTTIEEATHYLYDAAWSSGFNRTIQPETYLRLVIGQLNWAMGMLVSMQQRLSALENPSQTDE